MHPPFRALTLVALLALGGLAACSDDDGGSDAAAETTETTESTDATSDTTAPEAQALPDACELIPDAAAVTGLTLSPGQPTSVEGRSSCAFPTIGDTDPLTFAVQQGDRFEELADLASNSLGEGQEADGIGERALFFYSTEDLPEGVGGLLVDAGDGVTMTTTMQNLSEADIRSASEALIREAMENFEATG